MAKENRKSALIKRLKDSDDPGILAYVEAAFAINQDQWWESLPPNVQAAVEEGEADIRAGRVKSHADVMKQARGWGRK